MNIKTKGTASVISYFLLGTALVLMLGGAEPFRAQTSPAPAANGAPQTAVQKFKNIQVLKDIPADQLVPAMQFISASLGVECEYCHVHNAFDKDDKEKKKIARKMITMMMAINKDNFHGHLNVTCNSCHHGAASPAAIPAVADADARPEMRGPGGAGMNGEAAPPALTPPDQTIEKYVQAVGGADAFQKITSRVEKGTLSGFGPNGFPIDVYAKAPDKRVTVMHTPRGENITGFDGQVGWLSGFGPPRAVTGGELDAMRMNADFYFPVHLKQIFSQFRPRPSEKIGDQETNLIFGLKQGQPPVRLYFDQQSGLLIRMITYVQTPLGRIPTQTDFADYRDADGVKVPFRWTISRPGGRFTIQVNEIQQNVPVDDAKFAMPPAPPEKPPAP
ncbi:MAG TPA: c-type cytochrome [Terriglobia bacterium]|nr:c-type cytochrome [Terriglobia bacterium]